jgi:hypothetical protein
MRGACQRLSEGLEFGDSAGLRFQRVPGSQKEWIKYWYGFSEEIGGI